jgi:hypothetical protein
LCNEEKKEGRKRENEERQERRENYEMIRASAPGTLRDK